MQEEVEALSLRVLFYPKFHCEPDFIECYWCRGPGDLRVGMALEHREAVVPKRSHRKVGDRSKR